MVFKPSMPPSTLAILLKHKWIDEELSRSLYKHNYKESEELNLAVKNLVREYSLKELTNNRRTYAIKVLLIDLLVRYKLTNGEGSIGIFLSRTGAGNTKREQYHLLKVNGSILGEIVNELQNHELLEKQKGFLGHSTKLRAKPKLITFLKEHHISIDKIGAKVWPIRIENQYGWYEDMDEEKAKGYGLETLNKMNTLLAASSIQIGSNNIYIFEKRLVRLFKSEAETATEHYGRIHGPIWQSVKREYRQFIRINGDNTVEYDICSAFPALAYAQSGWDVTKSAEQKRKAYDVNCLDTKIKKLRDLVKLAFLCMLNGESQDSAVKAIAREISKKRLKYILPEGVKARTIVEELENKHKNLQDWFYNCAWKELSMLESNVCVDVISHFANKNIPVLPVHDSFVIQEQYGDELKKVLIKSFEKEANYEFKFPELLVERKKKENSYLEEYAKDALDLARLFKETYKNKNKNKLFKT
ncbi:hypothetical protein [Paraglaciecola arctica]|uniref:hypothetical protein n=1 Tax=Paraglaciecola arctica TaxID=1128911 RepID=UPI001C074D9E|nr:hypothetical protein [Paraglaciecola arctica]MBU3004747.1 hypothetical protein [Paraglaciecola arctica]